MMGLANEALLSQSVLFSPPEARSATCRDGKSEEDEDGETMTVIIAFMIEERAINTEE